jgi:hypothetical protein
MKNLSVYTDRRLSINVARKFTKLLDQEASIAFLCLQGSGRIFGSEKNLLGLPTDCPPSMDIMDLEFILPTQSQVRTILWDCFGLQVSRNYATFSIIDKAGTIFTSEFEFGNKKSKEEAFDKLINDLLDNGTLN